MGWPTKRWICCADTGCTGAITPRTRSPASSTAAPKRMDSEEKTRCSICFTSWQYLVHSLPNCCLRAITAKRDGPARRIEHLGGMGLDDPLIIHDLIDLPLDLQRRQHGRVVGERRPFEED